MKLDEATRLQVRRGRSKFAAMAATYGLGVFNDSFFRQSAMLLAVGWGLKNMQGWIMVVFALPYVLLAAPAGWLADRFAKRHVVIAAKLLELLAMGCGAVGICTGNWGLILAMVFTMGLQSCLFSPALNGSIPELYPAVYVSRANATLKVVVTAMILGGIATAGVTMSRHAAAWGGISQGRWLVAGGAVAIAALGVLGSFGVPYRPAASPNAVFPWTGPWETMRELATIWRDPLLRVVVAADAFAWFIGALLMPLINELAMVQWGYSEGMAGAIVAAELVGVAIGGILGSRLAVGPRWFVVLPVGALAMAALLGLTGAVPALPAAMQLPAVFVLLPLIGVAGGLFMIPCEAFVQVRPSADRKGVVIASVNFVVFSGIMLSGLVANLLIKRLPPTLGIAMAGAMALPVGVVLWWSLRKRDGE